MNFFEICVFELCLRLYRVMFFVDFIDADL